MRRTPRLRTSTRTATLAVVLVAALAAGCGVEPGGAVRAGGPPVTGPSGGGPDGSPVPPTGLGRLRSGPVPDVAVGEPAASLRSCAPGPGGDTVLVEAVVVNTTSSPRHLRGLPVRIVDRSGAAASEDEEHLTNTIVIGPGRRALVREEVELDGVREPSCELGEPMFERAGRRRGEAIPAASLRFDGCAPISVTVTNPSDRPVAVRVLVEAFDAAGHSAGTFELGQRPTTYSDGREPGPDEVALEPGATGSYEIDPAERVAGWETPLDGPVVACELRSATYEADVEPDLVLVD